MSDLIHIMVDLETMGTVPGCTILSIGAVVFNPAEGTLGAEFSAVVDEESCLEACLSVDPATEKWWSGQTDEAYKVVILARSGLATPLPEALARLNRWQQNLGPRTKLRIYGNGADFDNPILRVAYDCASVEPYAAGYGGRCYRTLKNLDELFGPQFRAHKLERVGVYHDALDDAKSQATHLMEIIARVRGATGE